MRFNVEGKLFQQQLQAVSKVINAKNTMQILDNFLLRVTGDTLEITGSDSENMVKAAMPVIDSQTDGAVAVSAKTLLEITKEIANQPITFEVDEETYEIDINFLTGHFNFMGNNPAEYPEQTPDQENPTKLVVPAKVVFDGIDKTLFAVSAETIRPVMTGIFWDIHKEDITFVASDTHKLVRYINYKTQPGIEASFIMPSKPAAIIKNIMQKEEGDVEIIMDSRSATFAFGSYLISCRFVKGNYPNYNRVIPQTNPFVMTVDKATLQNAMRRVSIFASKASNLVKFTLQPMEVILAAQDLDYQTSAEEKVPCQYEGNDMVIGFNAVYTTEILNNINCDEIVVRLADPARPGVFEPATQAEQENQMVIEMPLQVFD